MGDLDKDAIIRAVAEAAASRVCRPVIAELQKMRHTLSGDDSELKTTWDETCAQAQGENSVFWNLYKSVIENALAPRVAKLPRHELEALWLQTQEGERWDFSDEEDRGAAPVFEGDVVGYLVHGYVLTQAQEWTNSRIRAYLDRCSNWD